jgi:hypothetical protein
MGELRTIQFVFTFLFLILILSCEILTKEEGFQLTQFFILALQIHRMKQIACFWLLDIKSSSGQAHKDKDTQINFLLFTYCKWKIKLPNFCKLLVNEDVEISSM